ncbi:DUF4349 domain-containing protein [Haloarcula litorea]|uniref:DUF4349 domain-containing protein n=1 Tax=Haloarcula litorea TaxID=3032579 RepID=UPI0023E8206E|nr:DUF4349 domain-containing protein [Halomicroarcula sp. GDY20]
MSTTTRVLAVATLLLLAGCAGMGSNAGGGGDGAQLSAGAADGGGARQQSADQAGDGGDGGGTAQADVAAQQRSIIKRGHMVVEVENFSDSRAALAGQTRQYGGFVAGSSQRLHRTGNTTWTTGYVVLRVPSEDYGELQDDVADEGTVLSEETETEDVTDQLVDLEARLENLRERRSRLRTFYEEANGTEELLRIEEELSEVQGQIERLQAQKRSLERKVAYSTLRVELREPDPGPDQIRTQYHEQSLTAVFLGSVTDVYIFGRSALVTLVAAAPWLGVLAVPAYGLRRLLSGRSLPLVGSDGDAEVNDAQAEAATDADAESEDAEVDDEPVDGDT